MIARRHRFHGHNSLRFVYQRGRVARSQILTVKAIENTKRRDYRAAVVVSKKVNKSAVVRNRIRRRVYEHIRQLEPYITKPFDIVVSVYHEQAATMPANELHTALHATFVQLGIISKSSGQSPRNHHAIIKAKEN